MRYLFLIFLSVIFLKASAFACDPCALYNASRLQGHRAGALTLSVSEQYTDFNRAEDIPENSVRDGEFVRGFSTTQFALSYDITEEVGLQLTLPLIARRFDEVERFRNTTDSDAGLGDLSLVGTYTFLNHNTGSSAFLGGFTGGVKFPTGETGVLRDVSAIEGSALLKHHSIGAASGGRALTFGTGSYDYILGLHALSRFERYLLLSYAQYTIRTEGDFDYEFADDLLFSVGSGYYFLLSHDFTMAGLLALSGEFKGKDKLDGARLDGSAISNLYLGPQLLFTLNEKVGAELGFDFRITDEDRGATVVPEARLRAGVSYRFS